MNIENYAIDTSGFAEFINAAKASSDSLKNIASALTNTTSELAAKIEPFPMDISDDPEPASDIEICIKHDLKLSDRTFICNECGFTIDRDYQAALNLMRYEG